MSKRLIVGLGNPGADYAETRHNIGFMVADAIGERTRTPLTRRRDEAVFGWGRWRGREFGLAKPDTFMNRSGIAVEALLRRYKLVPADILVVVDDIHLPMGTLRARPQGGAGGHNGVQDIIDWLDTQEFPRLRLGIGREFPDGRQVDYVLSPFEADEREALEDLIKRASDAALTFVTDGITTVMNRFNG